MTTILPTLLLFLPPFLLLTYFLTTTLDPLPSSSSPIGGTISDPNLIIHPSLASLPSSLGVKDVYPEDLFEGGSEVQLPYGTVKYWLLGPEDGRKVVLVHGLSMPSIVFRDVAPELADRGFRVLVYDLYGRGYTEAPHTTYNVHLYTMQLALLMQHVRWESAAMVGMSMGGGIVGAFVSAFPWLVDGHSSSTTTRVGASVGGKEKVVLICPAGIIETKDMSRTTKFLSSRTVQWIASSYPVRAYMRWLADSTTMITEDPLAQIVRIQSAHLPGYNHALASTIRSGPIRGLHAAFSSPSWRGREVLIVHGTSDVVVPYRNAERVRELVRRGMGYVDDDSAEKRGTDGKGEVSVLTMEGKGHGVMMEEWEEVTRAIVDFFDDRT